jgi:hypothetical protein
VIDHPEFLSYLHVVRVAGLSGLPMPDLIEPPHTDMSSEQMHQVNTAYEASRAERIQRTIQQRRPR